MQVGLKERLIGAIVLVILAVIIIPWVLKGGSVPSTSVTQPLTLPPAAASSGQPAYHMALNNTAILVQPAAAGSGTAPAAITRAAVVGIPQSRPAPKAAVAPAFKPMQPTPEHGTHAMAVTGGWVVQAGSYSKEANARSVQSKLMKHGYHATISRFHTGSRTYYRVRVGPYTDRADAERIIKDVGRAFGGKAVVVPNT